MNTENIKIRWITTTCFEIKLHNGKTIVFDPWVGGEDPAMPGFTMDTGFTVDDFTGADYIFLSHTHGDHILDTKELLEKKNFDSCGGGVFMPAMSAMLYAEEYDIPLVRITGVYPYETMDLDDIIVTPLPCRHFGDKGVNVMDSPKEGRKKALESGRDMRLYDIMSMGTLEELDWAVSVKGTNFRFMVLGGRVYRFNNIYKFADEFMPNFVVRQVSNGATPEDYAKMIAKYNAPIVFPSHHDSHHLEIAQNMSYEEYFKKVNEHLEAMGSVARVINIKPCTWYSIGSFCREEA